MAKAKEFVMTEELEDQMDKLIEGGMSYDEALQTLQDDWAIDHMDAGDRLDWEDSPEEEKKKRKAMNKALAAETGKKRGPKPGSKKNKPADEEKRAIINAIQAALAQYGAEATNPECSVDFTIGDNSYTVKLTKHRPKKD